jgi:hypothetical protein
MAAYVLSEDDLIELNLLRGLEIDELVEAGLLSPSLQFDDTQLSELRFCYPEMILHMRTGPSYPASQLYFTAENLTMSRVSFDALRIVLRKIASDDAEANNYDKWSVRADGDPFEYEMTALHLVQKTVGTLKQLRQPDVPEKQGLPPKYKNDLIPSSGIRLPPLIHQQATLNDLALSVLGKTTAQVCEEIPPNFRVLHCENIIRQDNYNAFLAAQQRVRTRIMNTVSKDTINAATGGHANFWLERGKNIGKSELVDQLVKPKMTFHGTSNHLVPSIVRNGFLNPGDINPETGEKMRVRCGSTYGRGVYSSPSVDFSLSYSGTSPQPTTPNGFWGLKLIGCATVMGIPAAMTRDDQWWTRNKPFEGADSHVGNYEMEYIVFDMAQILPVYVVHLDWGEDNRKYFEDIPEDAANWVPKIHPKLVKQVLAPGDKQRAKEALTAKAAK